MRRQDRAMRVNDDPNEPAKWVPYTYRRSNTRSESSTPPTLPTISAT